MWPNMSDAHKSPVLKNSGWIGPRGQVERGGDRTEASGESRGRAAA